MNWEKGLQNKVTITRRKKNINVNKIKEIENKNNMEKIKGKTGSLKRPKTWINFPVISNNKYYKRKRRH